MQKITPFIWFDNRAEEAARFYTSVFKHAELGSITKAGPDGPTMSANVKIGNLELICFNGGPHFKLTEAFSLFVNADTQPEIDELYEKLSAGGTKQPCGWVKDQFGVSWQVIPKTLIELMNDKNPKKAGAVTQAMMKMHKIDIQALKDAHAAA
jgi:predicted 3-demethylubiquinone-9 3-methyltransferase (glyoxalase superfamily)